MRLREWNDDQAKWDLHRRFHMRFHGDWYSPLFTQFESGDMMLVSGKFNPDVRRTYTDIGVRIVAGHDPYCPKLVTPDGRRVPRAWIKSEVLVADLDTRVVVSTHTHPVNTWSGERPDYAKRASVYWPFPGARPQGRQVQLHRPKRLTKDERHHIVTLRAACAAWYEFSGKEAQYSKSWVPSCTWTSDELLRQQFVELDNDTRRSIATMPYQTSLEKEYVDYLVLAE